MRYLTGSLIWLHGCCLILPVPSEDDGSTDEITGFVDVDPRSETATPDTTATGDTMAPTDTDTDTDTDQPDTDTDTDV